MTLSRGHLVAFVAIALLPALIVIAVDARSTRANTRTRVRRETIRLAEGAANDDRDQLTATERLLAVIAGVPAVRTQSAGCEPFLRDQVSENGPYANFAVVTRDGAVLCSAKAPFATSDIVDHLRAALDSQRTVVSGVYSRSEGREIYVLRPGQATAGGVSTVVIAAIDLDKMIADVFATPLPVGAVTARFDRNGEFLVELGSSDRRAWPNGDPARLRQTLLGAPDGYLEQDGADGVPRVFAASSIQLGNEPAVTNIIGLSLARAQGLAGGPGVRDFVFVAVAALATLALTWVGSGRIVRGLRRSQAMARVQETNYRLLMEQAADAILILDSSGRVMEMNSAACELLRRTRTASVGHEYWELLATDSREIGDAAFARALKGESVRATVTLIRSDGTRLPTEISAKRLSDGRLQTIARDMTERLHLEEQLRQSQKMEAVGRLAGGIAHDFNNMLTVVLGYVELLRDELAGTRHEADIAEIRAAAERAAGLTRLLLTFSRRQVLQRQLFDLNVAIVGIERMLRQVIGEDIELVSRPAPVSAIINADKGHIDQIVMNLAVNARDAMPDGGRLVIAIEVDPAPSGPTEPRVRGRTVRLSVADTGTGMTDETKAHLFEPFFTTKPAGRGTGLGLAIVYGLVRRSDATIRVESELGRGTTFVIELPACDEAVEMDLDLDAVAAPARAAEGETILLVEDDEAVRRFAAGALRKHGFQVIELTGGDEALALADDHPPVDLLLTDVVMPHTSGIVLAARMVAARPGLRVVFMSGYLGEEESQSRALPPGAAFIQKPFDVTGLIRTIYEVLERGSVPPSPLN